MTAVVVTRAKSAQKSLSSRVNFYDFKTKIRKTQTKSQKSGWKFYVSILSKNIINTFLYLKGNKFISPNTIFGYYLNANLVLLEMAVYYLSEIIISPITPYSSQTP